MVEEEDTPTKRRERNEESNENEEQLLESFLNAFQGVAGGNEQVRQNVHVINPTFVTNGDVSSRALIGEGVAHFHTSDSIMEINEEGVESTHSGVYQRVTPDFRFQCTKDHMNTRLIYRIRTSERNGVNETTDAIGTCASIIKWGENDRLDEDQQTAFEILIATYVLSFKEEAIGPGELPEIPGLKQLARQKVNQQEPLIMFITGPAGAGKSQCLDSLMTYARAFSANITHSFCSTTIRASAITGSAALSIPEGDTTCRHFGTFRKKVTQEEIEEFVDTRMNIIDEISFATQKTLRDLSNRLQKLSQCPTYPYGRIPIVFLGDFCQLDGIGGRNIFEGEPSVYWELCLNQMVELKGMHRYAEDPILGKAMSEARDGNSTALRALLVSRLIGFNGLTIPQDLDARYAVYTNKKRSSINENVFRTFLKTFQSEDRQAPISMKALIIRCRAIWHCGKKPLGPNAHCALWENCSDGHIKEGSYKVDPFMGVFFGCDMMISDNINVSIGIANRTCCSFVKAVFKHDAQLHPMQIHGRWVNAVDIDDVDHIVLRYDDRHGPAFVGTFKLFPTSKVMTVKFPNLHDNSKERSKMKMNIWHLPVLSNYATTVHKLQGKLVDSLVIVDWCKARNWAYVVLSRVRTLAGIFLCKPLPADISFEPHPEYLSMMTRLRSKILAKPRAH